MHNIIDFFKFLLSSNTVNFIFMVAILVWICKKLQLGRVLDLGSERVAEVVNKSEIDVADAKKAYFEIQQNIEKLPDVVKTIEDDSMKDVDLIKSRIESETDEAVLKLRQSITVSIEREENQISNELINQTISKVIETTECALLNRLERNSELQKKFIEKSLDEFERLCI